MKFPFFTKNIKDREKLRYISFEIFKYSTNNLGQNYFINWRRSNKHYFSDKIEGLFYLLMFYRLNGRNYVLKEKKKLWIVQHVEYMSTRPTFKLADSFWVWIGPSINDVVSKMVIFLTLSSPANPYGLFYGVYLLKHFLGYPHWPHSLL